MTVETLTQELSDLAAAQIEGLRTLIEVIALRPQVAPLVEYALRNMAAPLGGMDDPHAALDEALGAFMMDTDVEESGTDEMLGFTARAGAVCVWFFTPRPALAEDIAEDVVPDPDAILAAEPEQAAGGAL